jgi:hypothetical protein
LIFIFLNFPLNVALGEQTSLKITPLTYKLTIDQGGSESATVSIINPNKIEIMVVAETEDFLQADEEGSPRFISKGAGKTTLAEWINIDRQEIKLMPGEKRDVPFEIMIPENAENGGHYAAIFFRSIPLETEDSQITVASRVGTLVLVTVPGDISAKGEIVEFKLPQYSEHGPISFLARFKDTGTVHYQLGGTITITNLFGKEVAKLDLPEHIVLPDGVRRFETQWPVKWTIGRYEAKLQMRDGDGNLKTDSKIFYVFPWKYGLAALGVIIVLIIVIIFAKIRSKNKKNQAESIKVE